MNNVHFTSISAEWETPQTLFDDLNSVFNFETDLACTKENAKCKKFYTQEDDSLKQEWKGNCFLNPPYGRVITDFIGKAIDSIYDKETVTIVCIVPARVDTAWFHRCFSHAKAICFIKGRLKFNNKLFFFNKDGTPKLDKKGKPKKITSAPFPSAIVIFTNKGGLLEQSKNEILLKYGYVLHL